MDNFWYEKWLSDNWCFFFGRIDNFRIGFNIGLDNDLYLGFWNIGISKMG